MDLSDEKLRYLPVKFNGEMDTGHQLLIDNQVKQGSVGYFVLTPVKLNNGQAILLNRGWLPLGNSRDDLPDIKVDADTKSFIGRLDKFPSVGIKLEGADELSAGWPAVTQLITPEKVAERLGYSVMAYQVLLNVDEPNGYNRQWVPMKMGPQKHHGYAFQWFALAVAWVVIYFVLTVKIKRKEE
jgi:surfeit locus 1 family protein